MDNNLLTLAIFSCRSCLSSDNLCGWCLYDKKCTSSSDQCRVVTDWINVSSTSIVSVMY